MKIIYFYIICFINISFASMITQLTRSSLYLPNFFITLMPQKKTFWNILLLNKLIVLREEYKRFKWLIEIFDPAKMPLEDIFNAWDHSLNIDRKSYYFYLIPLLKISIPEKFFLNKCGNIIFMR